IIQEIYENGVSVNVHFQPLPLLSFYKGLKYKMKDYPQAYENYKCEISLPVYYDLSDEDAAKVVEVVKTAVAKIIENK
ncbi:MAG: DegT/DnrJ/EryC1/StrS family aminotransferase, partial [Bacteroidales bacterium]